MSTWNEQDHPRVPGGKVNGGQFTDKQLNTAVDAAQSAAGLPAMVERSIMAKVEEIADLDHERLYIFNPTTGQALYKVEGTEDSVELDAFYRSKCVNNALLHNHPGGDRYLMFSFADLGLFQSYNVKEAWLTAGDHVLVVRRPAAMYQWPHRAGSRIVERIVDGLAQIGDEAGWASLDDVQWMHNANASLPEVRDVVVDAYKSVGLEAYWKKWR